MDALPPLGEPTALLLTCLVSGLLVPLPEDVALLVAGWEIRQGALHPGLALAAGIVGTLGRDLVAFGLGRLVGPRIETSPVVRRLLGERRIARGHALFAAYGTRMLFATRFAVGMRAPLYFTGGSLGYPLRRFLVLDGIGLALTVPLALGLGFGFGADAAEALAAAVAHQRVVLGALAALGLAWLAWKRSRREA